MSPDVPVRAHNIGEIPPLFPFGAQAPRMSAVLRSPYAPNAAKLPMSGGAILVRPKRSRAKPGIWLAQRWSHECWGPGPGCGGAMEF